MILFPLADKFLPVGKPTQYCKGNQKATKKEKSYQYRHIIFAVY